MTAIENSQRVETDILNLGSLFSIVWRGKFRVLLSIVLACVIGGYYAFFLAEPKFTTTATVVQEVDKEPVIDFSQALGSSALSGGGDQSAINTEIEVIRSRGLLEKLVRNLDLLDDPEFNHELRPPKFFSAATITETIRSITGLQSLSQIELSDQQILDAVVDELRDVLAVTNTRQSYVFNIGVISNDAEKSAAIANGLAELYILDQVDVKSTANANALEWLTNRLTQLRTDLEQAETAVKDFSAATDLINEDSLAALQRQVKELRDRLETEKSNAADLAVHLQLLQSNGLDQQQKVLFTEDRLLERLLSAQLSGEPTDASDFDSRFAQIVSQTKLELGRLNAQVSALETSISQQESASDQQSNDFLTLQQLQREATASGVLYEFFLGRLKETSVQSGIQEADSRILSRAVVPLDPSAPQKTIILALAIFVGFCIGITIVLIREFSNSSFRASEELESHTGVPVLGQIPTIPAGRRSKVLKYLTDKPTSTAAEAIRNLRTSVLLSDSERPPQVIMSTSSLPGEGKTTQSLGLAQNLAGLGKKVLLVEGDIRKLVFAQYFSITSKEGLISVLNGKTALDDATIFEPSLNADVLIGEKSEINAADVFSGKDFDKLLKDMRELYDYIIIDTPPVLAVPDARVIGRSVDAVIYTVKWDSTSQRQVSEGLKSLRSVGVKVTGLVLAQIDPKGQKKYGYGDTSTNYGSYHEN